MLTAGLLLVVSLQAQATLGSEIAARKLPAPPGVDVDAPITSYAADGGDTWFAIAYYEQTPDNRLDRLIVRTYDTSSRRWRSARFEPVGSVLRVDRAAGYWYVTGHDSPSSSPLLVLDGLLTKKRQLDGWTALVLADGRVIFQRSMPHFQPAHAGVLAIYDPRTDRDLTFYPSGAADSDRGFERVPGSASLALDRSIGDVTSPRPGTLTFEVAKEVIRSTTDGGRPAGPVHRLTVTCDVRPTLPICRESPADGRQ